MWSDSEDEIPTKPTTTGRRFIEDYSDDEDDHDSNATVEKTLDDVSVESEGEDDEYNTNDNGAKQYSSSGGNKNNTVNRSNATVEKTLDDVSVESEGEDDEYNVNDNGAKQYSSSGGKKNNTVDRVRNHARRILDVSSEEDSGADDETEYYENNESVDEETEYKESDGSASDGTYSIDESVYDDDSIIEVLSSSDDNESDDDDSVDNNTKKMISTFKELDVSPSFVGKTKYSDTDTEGDTGGWHKDEETGDYCISKYFKIPSSVYSSLYPHQKEGVLWMASLHNSGVGGILGDDMGMGKTYQTVTLLGGMMKSRTVRNALIVCPLTVMRTWEKEARKILKKCVPKVTITLLSSDISKNRRRTIVREAICCSSKRPHLLVTTYGIVGSNPQDMLTDKFFGEKMVWDYVVLDEGHKIKNPSTKMTKGCHEICGRTTKRLLLTGTPIQNNLKELWCLVDWATSGNVLGSLKEFMNRFGYAIEEGRHKDASDACIKNANKANDALQSALRPNFLQRMKKTTFDNELPTKTDYVVWTHLSSKQRSLYENYVQNGDSVQCVLNGEVKSPLQALTWLKKLCGHPCLVDNGGSSFQVHDSNKTQLIEESAKLQTLLSLVTHLTSSGHRALIFSQSTRMLDIIQHVLPVRQCRIDGSMRERDRQKSIEKFSSGSIPVMLLSTKAAGLGLTLTTADTAIIYDPSWNPAEDSQAIDRCYRIGQKKDVTVFRLIAAGTVEERMYEKQVHKDGIRRMILTDAGCATERYFSKADLCRLFRLAPIGICEMMDKFPDAKVSHTQEEKTNEGSILNSHPSVVGFSSHDLLYTNVVADVEGENLMPFNKKSLVSPRANFGKENVDNHNEIQRLAANIVKKSKSNDGANLDISLIMKKADEFTRNQNFQSAIDVLMEVLETKNGPTIKEKMVVHKKISHLAKKLNWL